MRPQAEAETTRQGSRRHRMVTVGVLALALAGACSPGDQRSVEKTSEASPPPATATSTTATTAPYQNPAVAAAVEAAYRGGAAALVEYNSQTGPFDPVRFREVFSQFFTGVAYEAVFNAAQKRRLRGEVFQPPGLQPGELAVTVTVEGPARATVLDCAPDHPTVKAASGERVDEPIEGRELSISDIVLEDGKWKTADIRNTRQPCTV